MHGLSGEDDNLFTNVTITLEDAPTGFETDIKHLDGHSVHVVRDKLTSPEARMMKPREGMPNYKNKNINDFLLITFDIDFPKAVLSEEDKKGIREILKQGSKQDVYNDLQLHWL